MINLSQNMELNISASISLMLNPRMLQMLRILNLPYHELIEQINTEAEENPLLEIERRDAMIEYLKFQSNTPLKEPSGEGGTEEKANLEDYIRKGTNLEEHLSSQIDLIEISDEQKEVILHLIKSLDGNGYLTDYLRVKDEIIKEFGIDENAVEAALETLQTFEPDGIAGRDVKECLLIQVREYNFENDDLKGIMGKAIDLHLDDIAKHNLTKMAESLGIPLEGAEQIASFIKSNLNPYPGAHFASASAPAIPSFSIKKEGEKYKITNLETTYGPQINISSQYLKILEDPKTDKKTIDYLKEKLQSAKNLIEQILKRHETIDKIAQMIADTQKDYFDGKAKFPKALTQKEISDKFGIHPSTTSRAIAEKYMETPKGVIKLKSLCPRQFLILPTANIKDMVLGIISNEDKKHPLTDSQIQDRLKELNIEVERRTISDYRKHLAMESASKRRIK